MNTLQAHADWHWPDFGPVLCGTMTDRERLGLPDRYVAGRLDAAIATAYAQWRTAPIDTLLGVLDRDDVALADRIAAGNLLALSSDPRMDPILPEMVDIAGGAAWIGLDAPEVDAVLLQFRGLGLDRSWIAKECPRHAVHLQPYRMGRFPVTNAQYQAFLCDTDYAELPTSWSFRQYPQAKSNHPVYTLSADAADAYAHWLSARTGRAFRLPRKRSGSGPQQGRWVMNSHGAIPLTPICSIPPRPASFPVRLLAFSKVVNHHLGWQNARHAADKSKL